MSPVTGDTGKGAGIANADLLYFALHCTLISTPGRRGSQAAWRTQKLSAGECGRKLGQSSAVSNTHNTLQRRFWQQEFIQKSR